MRRYEGTECDAGKTWLGLGLAWGILAQHSRYACMNQLTCVEGASGLCDVGKDFVLPHLLGAWCHSCTLMRSSCTCGLLHIQDMWTVCKAIVPFVSGQVYSAVFDHSA